MPTGHSGTWSFGTSGYTNDVISIDPAEETRDSIPLPHLGITKGEVVPKEAGDLVEGGTYTIEIADDQRTFQATSGTTEVMTWTKPLQSGDSTAASVAFPGLIVGIAPGTQATSERATVSLTVDVAGTVTKTTAAES